MDFPNCTEEVFATNNSSCASLETTKLPTSKILLSITLSVLAVVTTFLNCLVITAIAVTRKLHHPANYLICSLAVTDLLVAVLVMPFSIMYIQKESWGMGPVMCTIWLSVDITCCTCSILHLAAIAIDRYRAITDAVEYSRKRTGKMAGAMVSVVWFLSILISLPPLLWRHYTEDGDDEDQCIIVHHNMAFTLYSTLGAFYIPLLLILILYYKIYQAAQTLYMRREASRASRHSCMTNGSMIPSTYPAGDGDVDGGPRSPEPVSPPEKSYSEPSNEEPPRERVRASVKPIHGKSRRRETRNESRRSQFQQGPRISNARERRAASTLGLIIGAFVICWLPFFVKEVIVNTCNSCSTSVEMADFLTWLGYLNSLINPLIYTIFNEDFKKAFQRLVRCTHYL
ncbi:5-hydroxytryptamine receptor 1F [Acanthochromis polyacanthus]|uniref:5-hydroxytryptamine receptor 1F n=1 Tax=Acanthochromis polyacanthus TaxID=80966 RepID=A0A3Q1EI98_9TELE|nr:5-hydroxytryptamine receptor 1F [Acanthochromis polyacanthus]